MNQKQQIDESWERTKALFTSFFTGSGLSGKDIQIINGYKKQFVSTAIGALTNAINSGIVDVSKTGFGSNNPNMNVTVQGQQTGTTTPNLINPANAPSGNLSVKNPNYQNWNMVFEAIVNAGTSESIAQYLLSWFQNYTKNFGDYSRYTENIKKIILDVEAAYKQNPNSAKKPLEQLAALTWAVKNSSPQTKQAKQSQSTRSRINRRSSASTTSPTATQASPTNVPSPPPATQTSTTTPATSTTPSTSAGNNPYATMVSAIKQFKQDNPALYPYLKQAIEADLIQEAFKPQDYDDEFAISEPKKIASNVQTAQTNPRISDKTAKIKFVREYLEKKFSITKVPFGDGQGMEIKSNFDKNPFANLYLDFYGRDGNRMELLYIPAYNTGRHRRDFKRFMKHCNREVHQTRESIRFSFYSETGYDRLTSDIIDSPDMMEELVIWIRDLQRWLEFKAKEFILAIKQNSKLKNMNDQTVRRLAAQNRLSRMIPPRIEPQQTTLSLKDRIELVYKQVTKGTLISDTRSLVLGGKTPGFIVRAWRNDLAKLYVRFINEGENLQIIIIPRYLTSVYSFMKFCQYFNYPVKKAPTNKKFSVYSDHYGSWGIVKTPNTVDSPEMEEVLRKIRIAQEQLSADGVKIYEKTWIRKENKYDKQSNFIGEAFKPQDDDEEFAVSEPKKIASNVQTAQTNTRISPLSNIKFVSKYLEKYFPITTMSFGNNQGIEIKSTYDKYPFANLYLAFYGRDGNRMELLYIPAYNRGIGRDDFKLFMKHCNKDVYKTKLRNRYDISSPTGYSGPTSQIINSPDMMQNLVRWIKDLQRFLENKAKEFNTNNKLRLDIYNLNKIPKNPTTTTDQDPVHKLVKFIAKTLTDRNQFNGKIQNLVLGGTNEPSLIDIKVPGSLAILRYKFHPDGKKFNVIFKPLNSTPVAVQSMTKVFPQNDRTIFYGSEPHITSRDLPVPDNYDLTDKGWRNFFSWFDDAVYYMMFHSRKLNPRKMKSSVDESYNQLNSLLEHVINADYKIIQD